MEELKPCPFCGMKYGYNPSEGACVCCGVDLTRKKVESMFCWKELDKQTETITRQRKLIEKLVKEVDDYHLNRENNCPVCKLILEAERFLGEQNELHKTNTK